MHLESVTAQSGIIPRNTWGEEQADLYVEGLFAELDALAKARHRWKPVPERGFLLPQRTKNPRTPALEKKVRQPVAGRGEAGREWRKQKPSHGVTDPV